MPERADRMARSGRFGLVFLAALAPSLLGGYPLWASFILAAASLALLFFAISRPRELSFDARLLASLFLAGLLIALLQLLPLPAPLLRLIAPESFAERASNYIRLGLDPPHTGTISIAPYETNLFIVRALGPLAVFLTSLSFIRRPSDRLFIVRALALIGAAFALIGLLHRGLGMERLFGVYAPVYAHPELLTPLLNSNHLAGLFILCSPLALALAMSRSPSPGWALGAFFLMTLAVLLTGSRGGIAAYFVALALFALIRKSSNTGSATGSSLPLSRPLFFTLLGAVALIGLRLGAAPLIRDLKGEQLDAKLVLFERGLSLALGAPLLGYGRGAFGVMMSDRYPYDEEVRFAENAIIQRIADLGLPLALLFISLLIYLFIRAIRGRRSNLSAALIAGLVGLALQNLVDYSLELPGLAMPAALALGALLIPRRRSAERVQPLSKATLLGLAACLTIAGLASANFIYSHEPLRALNTMASEQALPGRDEQLELLDAHPRSAGVALGIAHFYRIYAPDLAAPQLNRALELAPHWSRTHLELASWLLDQSRPSQAAIHLREAAAIDHRAIRELACDFIERDALEEVVEAAPSSVYEARYFDALLRCAQGDAERSVALEALILARSPEHLEANLRMLQRSCRDHETRDEGAARLRELSRVHQRDPRPALALLSCLKIAGAEKDAEKEAKAIVARMPYTRERVREILSR